MQLQARVLLSIAVIWLILAEAAARPSSQQSPDQQPLRREARENTGFYTSHQDAGISKPEHRTDEELRFYGGAKGQYLVNHPVYGLVSSVRLAELKEKGKKEKEDEDQENEEESEEHEESEIVEIQPPPKGASVAEAKPVGLAIAGEGGVAASKPVATAVVGPNGLAIARPVATAIAGVRINEALLGGLGGDDNSSNKPQKPPSAKAPSRPKTVAVGPHKSPDSKYGVFPLLPHSSASQPIAKAAQQYLYYPIAYY